MSLPRAYEDPQELGDLGGVQPFAQAHKLKTPQSTTDSPIGVELYTPQTPTDPVSYHAHVGL